MRTEQISIFAANSFQKLGGEKDFCKDANKTSGLALLTYNDGSTDIEKLWTKGPVAGGGLFLSRGAYLHLRMLCQIVTFRLSVNKLTSYHRTPVWCQKEQVGVQQ